MASGGAGVLLMTRQHRRRPVRRVLDMSLPTHTVSDAELMARYDISCAMIPQYQYKTWRYGKLSDAIAQARRIESASAAAA
jgi:hypothetical protein